MPSAPVAGAVDEMANSSQARREFDNEGFEWSRELSRTLERVFGQLKFNRQITRFQRRGRAACRSEWRMIAATHNLLKLHRHQIAAAAV